MKENKFKIGDKVKTNWFPSTKYISHVMDMDLSVDGKITRIYGDAYEVNNWWWPEDALEFFNPPQQA